MKPYGIGNKFLYNYKDYHPKNGLVNWWENERNVIEKRERQKSKKIINEYLEEYYNENQDQYF